MYCLKSVCSRDTSDTACFTFTSHWLIPASWLSCKQSPVTRSVCYKELTLSSSDISTLPILLRQTCLSTVTLITSSCIDNTCPYKSVFRCFSSYKLFNRNNNVKTRQDSVVLNKRDKVRTFMAKLKLGLDLYLIQTLVTCAGRLLSQN